MNISLILSAGASARFGGDLPKQYHKLCGREVIAYTINAMLRAARTDKIIVMADKEYIGYLNAYEVIAAEGGDTRNRSLKNGLLYIKQHYPKCEKVFINEAARPFITAELVDDYFDKLDVYDAVITTQRITDSLGREGYHVTDRGEYYLVQAPEAFRYSLLYKHFDADSWITATVQHLPEDIKVYRNFDFRHNFKITYPEDIAVAGALMECNYILS